MYTEADLRDALTHSADRAGAIASDTRGGVPVDIVADDAPERARRRPVRAGRRLLPAAAAATVLLTAGAIVVAGSRPDRSDPQSPHEPARVELVDLAMVSSSATTTTGVPIATDYGFKDVGVTIAGGEYVYRSLGDEATDGTVVVSILPARLVRSSAIERGRKVPIAGTTGWYAERKTLLLDGEAGGKDAPLPLWTIAFRTPSGDWAFARIDGLRRSSRGDRTYDPVSINDAARIGEAYSGLDVRFVRDTARQPLRLGYLPSGMTLQSASFSVTAGVVDSESLIFVRGGKRVEVAFSTEKGFAKSRCRTFEPTPDGEAPVCRPLPSVATGNGEVVVEATGFPRADERKIVKAVTAAADPKNYLSFEDAVSR